VTDRYPDMSALADDLDRVRRGEPVHAPRVNRRLREAERDAVEDTPRLRAKRVRVVISAGAAVAVLSVAALVFGWIAQVNNRVAHARQRTNGLLLRDAGYVQLRYGDPGVAVHLLVQSLAEMPADDADGEAATRTALALGVSRLIPLRQVLRVDGQVRRLAVSPDQRLALVATDKARIYYVDLARAAFRTDPLTNEPLEVVTGENPEQGSVASVAFSPDGQRFAAVTNARRVLLFDTATAKPIAFHTGGRDNSPVRHPGRPMSVAFRPDGRAILVASRRDKTAAASGAVPAFLTEYDSASGVQLRSFPTGSELYEGVYSPEGRWVACAGETLPTPRVTVWRADAAGEPQTLLHPTRVFTLAFSPDGKTLATGCIDGTVHFWTAKHSVKGGDVGEAAEKWEADGIPLTLAKQARLVAFSPDGHWLLTGAEDGVARL